MEKQEKIQDPLSGEIEEATSVYDVPDLPALARLKAYRKTEEKEITLKATGEKKLLPQQLEFVYELVNEQREFVTTICTWTEPTTKSKMGALKFYLKKMGYENLDALMGQEVNIAKVFLVELRTDATGKITANEDFPIGKKVVLPIR